MYLHLVHPHPVQLLSSPFVHSILRHKPGSWKLWVWNDASLRALVTRHHGARAAAQFDACPGIIKADWGRYLVLYDHGGVYLDTDVFAVAPLDGLFDGGDEGAVWYAQSPALAPTMSNTATNYALASPAGKNVWLRASYEIQRRADSWLAKWAPFRSGAFVLTKVMRDCAEARPIPPRRLGNLLCYNDDRHGTVATHVGGNARGGRGWNPSFVVRCFAAECFVGSGLACPRTRGKLPSHLFCVFAFV